MPFVTESINSLGIFFCVQGWPIPLHWCVDHVGVCLFAGVGSGLEERFCKGGGKNQTLLHCKAACKASLAAVMQHENVHVDCCLWVKRVLRDA